MWKDVRVIFRDRAALIFALALPVAVVLTFGLIFGGRSDRDTSMTRIVVANEDRGAHGAEIVAALSALGLTVEQRSEEEVLSDLRTGRRAMALIVPPDFSASVQQAVAARTAGVPAEKAPQAHLKILIDPAQASIAGMAQGAVGGAAQRVVSPIYRAAAMSRVPSAFRGFADKLMGASAMPKPGDPLPARQAVALDTRQVSGNLDGAALRARASLGDIMVPDYAVLFVFFLANGIATSLINERQEGTLKRMLCAPVTPGQIMFGKLLARIVVGSVQIGLLFTIGKLWLHLGTGSSPIGLILTALASIVAAAGLGLAIASFGKTAEQVNGMTTLALILMGAISGCMVPRMLLPESMQRLSLVTPHAWALTAYQDLLLRRLPLAATAHNIVVELLFGVGFYLLALMRFRYE